MDEATRELLIAACAGVIGVPLVQLLKGWLKWDGKKAFLLTAAVSVILGILVMFLSGQVVIADFTLDNLSRVTGMVFLVASTIYKLIVKSEETS